MFEGLKEKFRQVLPETGFCSLRAVRESNEIVQVRQSVLQPITRYEDQGVMVTVVDGGGYGYAATSDLSVDGLRTVVERAQAWAKLSAGKGVIDYSQIAYPHPSGEFASPVEIPWETVSLKDKIDLVTKECERLKIDDRIADYASSLWYVKTDHLYLTNEGGEVTQAIERLLPILRVTASEGAESQTRNLGAGTYALQGGMEIIDKVGFKTEGPRLAQEAIDLLSAPNCPTGTMDLLLAPDQMHLQIHESIGHPLEIDRILGDERNYAGTTFVKPDDIGSFRYGSDLLNITYDPTIPEQWASFGFDDDGLKAEKLFIIERGILKRALGGLVSQARSGLPGVATTRADGWRRPPIDRMSNLNLEPGDASFEDLVGSIENGIYMQTNTSWSIDDSRNKFQFGCEWGQLIENGKLTKLVRKPNYRGISGTFWNNLKMVGDKSTFRVLGVPNCGKGEPNQIMKVGHASPAALFADVEVFGGE